MALAPISEHSSLPTISHPSSAHPAGTSAATLNSSPSVLKGLVDFNESFRTWRNFLQLIGHPTQVSERESRRAAWKGVVDALLLLLDMVSKPITSKKALLQQQVAAMTAGEGTNSSTAGGSPTLEVIPDLARKFLPQGRTLLHIFGPAAV